MKALNSLIAWMYIFLTIVFGLFLIAVSSGWYIAGDIINSIIADQLHTRLGIWTGTGIVLLGIIFMAMRVKSYCFNKSISFDNPEGEVTLSIKAIEDFVKKVGYEFMQVADISPNVYSAKDGIRMKIKTALTAGANIPRVTESLQQTIKNRLQNILGIENVTLIEIHVSKLVSKGGKGEQSQPSIDIA